MQPYPTAANKEAVITLGTLYTTETIYPTATTTQFDLVFETTTASGFDQTASSTLNDTPTPDASSNVSWEERLRHNLPLLLGLACAGIAVLSVVLFCFLYRLIKIGKRVYKRNRSTADASSSTGDRPPLAVPTFSQCISESYGRAYPDQHLITPRRNKTSDTTTTTTDNNNNNNNNYNTTQTLYKARSASLSSLQRWIATLYNNSRKSKISYYAETDDEEKALDSVKLQLTRERERTLKALKQGGKKNSLPALSSSNNRDNKKIVVGNKSAHYCSNQRQSFSIPSKNTIGSGAHKISNRVSSQKKVTIEEKAVFLDNQMSRGRNAGKGVTPSPSWFNKLIYGGPRGALELDTGWSTKNLPVNKDMMEVKKNDEEQAVVFTCAGASDSDPMNLKAPLSPTFKPAPSSPMKLVKRDEILASPHRQRGIDEIDFAYEDKIRKIMRNVQNGSSRPSPRANRVELSERAKEKQRLNSYIDIFSKKVQMEEQQRGQLVCPKIIHSHPETVIPIASHSFSPTVTASKQRHYLSAPSPVQVNYEWKVSRPTKSTVTVATTTSSSCRTSGTHQTALQN